MTAPENDPSDEALLDGYFGGDAEAFRLFAERHGSKVIRYAVAKGLKPELAQEVAQEAFLKLHRFIHTYEHGRPALRWFFSIVHRCVVDSHRLAQRSREVSAGEAVEEFAAAAPERTEKLGGSALVGLSVEQREVLELRAVEGFSFREIAQRTGKSEQTARKIFERAKRQLKSVLRKEE